MTKQLEIRSTTTPEKSSTPNQAIRVQKFRLLSQLFSLAINLWIGIQFYLFVAYLNRGATEFAVSRPPGVEGWLPIGALVSLRYWWQSWTINDIHPAGLVIFVTIVLTAFLFKKGFCSWVCPVGFISELLGDLSDKLFGRKLKLPRWLDYPLRSLKYLLLGFFFWAVLWSMTGEDIASFVYSDYNKVADVQMLRFFTDITATSLYIITGLFVLSFFFRGFWCRYLCPYGGLLGLLSLVSPTRIRRKQTSCIDCGSCAAACPSFIKVDKVTEVISDECTGCLACVDACPVSQTLELKSLSKKKTVTPIKWAAAAMFFFWGILLIAKLWGPWENSLTEQDYRDKMDQMNRGELIHP